MSVGIFEKDVFVKHYALGNNTAFLPKRLKSTVGHYLVIGLTANLVSFGKTSLVEYACQI